MANDIDEALAQLNDAHPTYPHSKLIGYDLVRDLSKEQWLALVVDLLQSSISEDVSVEIMRGEIIERMDAMYAAGIVPRTLPRGRYRRPI